MAQDPWADIGAVPVSAPAPTNADPWTAIGAQPVNVPQWKDITPDQLKARQAASKAAFDANLPKNQAPPKRSNITDLMVGVDPATFLDRLKGAASTVTSMLPGGSTPRPNTDVPLNPQQEIGAKTMGVAGLVEGAQALGQRAYNALSSPSVNPLATGANDATIKAIRNIRKLSPTTAEAQATAGRIANEALTRGSVPEAGNFAVRDSKVFRQLLDSETELKAAKAETPLTQQSVNGKQLVDEIQAAITRNQTAAPINPQYGAETTSVQGGQYTPISSYAQADPAVSGRVKGLEQIKQQTMGLMDNNGNIRADRLQQFKETLDKDIFDHNGWKDTGTAADKSNLQAMREANGYVRQALRDLGNTRLNAANDAFSHQSDIAKIVDIRRPDLQGLSTADKIQAALVPMKGSPAAQFAKATARKIAPYAIGGGLVDAYYRATRGR